MTQETLYKECPLCAQSPVTAQPNGEYQCGACGLTLKEKSTLGLFNKGRFGVEKLGPGNYAVASASLKAVALPPERLKIVLGNVYTDDELAKIAGGSVEVIRPVRTVLAQIILEQLREECFVNVAGLRRGHGAPLSPESWYQPDQKAALAAIQWQDEGNLFCTTQRLVLPSNQFTFIRLGRKIAAVQAYNNAVAIQVSGEDFSTYFTGCLAHEAALVAAYVMARVPLLRSSNQKEQHAQSEDTQQS